MKYLCLAYGDEDGWKGLTESEQHAVLAQDEVVRKRGAIMAAVQQPVTCLRAWDGKPSTTAGPFPDLKTPLAGFSIIEAPDLDEVVRLLAGTPCAYAKGVIEIRPIRSMTDT